MFYLKRSAFSFYCVCLEVCFDGDPSWWNSRRTNVVQAHRKLNPDRWDLFKGRRRHRVVLAWNRPIARMGLARPSLSIDESGSSSIICFSYPPSLAMLVLCLTSHCTLPSWQWFFIFCLIFSWDPRLWSYLNKCIQILDRNIGFFPFEARNESIFYLTDQINIFEGLWHDQFAQFSFVIVIRR